MRWNSVLGGRLVPVMVKGVPAAPWIGAILSEPTMPALGPPTVTFGPKADGGAASAVPSISENSAHPSEARRKPALVMGLSMDWFLRCGGGSGGRHRRRAVHDPELGIGPGDRFPRHFA